MIKFTAQSIAELLNGKLEGNPDALVDKIARIEDGTDGALSFLANPKYTQYIYTTESSVVIVNNNFQAEKQITATLIRVEDAYLGFARVLEYYNQYKLMKTGISGQAILGSNCTLGKDVYIGPLSVIGDGVTIGSNVKIFPQVYIGDHARIGDHTVIYPGVRIYDGMVIGHHCTLHAGVVIGSDGFGFAMQENNPFQKVAQIGNVIIEDHVEIGSNTTIDRATIGSTIIRRGVKLDNLIQIAHNVEIGENTAIAAQAGISGSTKIGRNCLIGGKAGIVGHLKIGDNVKIAAGSGISNDIPDGMTVFGAPAMEASRFRRAFVLFRNLPEIVARLSRLEKILKVENKNTQ